MRKIINTCSYIVLIVIIIALTEANAKVFYSIDQFKINSVVTVILALVKAIGFSLATVIIVIYYQKNWIKLLFVVIDGVIIYNYNHVVVSDWWVNASYIYAIYTSLIFVFVGNMAHIHFKHVLSSNENITSKDKDRVINELNTALKDANNVIKSTDIKRRIANLKRTGKNGTPWVELPDIAKQINELEKELNDLN